MAVAAPFIIMAAVAAMQAGMQYMQAKQQANAEADNAALQAKQAANDATMQIAEVDRQQGEVNRVAQEQKQDRMAATRRELGTLRVIAGEQGAAGSLQDAMVGEVGYFAGLDLSRIDANRKANIDAGQAQKKAASQGAKNMIDIAANQRKVANKTIGMAAIGAGVQIAGAAASAYGDYKTSKQP
jgi:hypothetical protein